MAMTSQVGAEHLLLSSVGSRERQIEAAAVSATFFVLSLVSLSQAYFSAARGLLLELALFSAVRGAAFVFRAIAEVSPSQSSFAMFDALLAAGFYALVSVLFSTNARWMRRILGQGPLSRLHYVLRRSIQGMSRTARAAALICAICAVTGSIKTFANGALPSDLATGHRLREISAVGYVIICSILVLVSLVAVALGANKMPGLHTSQSHHCMEMLTLAACSLLLELKAIFLVVGAFQPDVAYDQLFFYPLSVLPEVLIVVVLVFPGFLSTLTVDMSTPSQIQERLLGQQQEAKQLLSSQRSWSGPFVISKAQLMTGMYAV